MLLGLLYVHPSVVVIARQRAAVQAQPADEACAAAYLVAVRAVQGKHTPVAVRNHDLRPVVEGDGFGHERPLALLVKAKGPDDRRTNEGWQ